MYKMPLFTLKLDERKNQLVSEEYTLLISLTREGELISEIERCYLKKVRRGSIGAIVTSSLENPTFSIDRKVLREIEIWVKGKPDYVV